MHSRSRSTGWIALLLLTLCSGLCLQGQAGQQALREEGAKAVLEEESLRFRAPLERKAAPGLELTLQLLTPEEKVLSEARGAVPAGASAAELRLPLPESFYQSPSGALEWLRIGYRLEADGQPVASGKLSLGAMAQNLLRLAAALPGGAAQLGGPFSLRVYAEGLLSHEPQRGVWITGTLAGEGVQAGKPLVARARTDRSGEALLYFAAREATAAPLWLTLRARLGGAESSLRVALAPEPGIPAPIVAAPQEPAPGESSPPPAAPAIQIRWAAVGGDLLLHTTYADGSPARCMLTLERLRKDAAPEPVANLQTNAYGLARTPLRFAETERRLSLRVRAVDEAGREGELEESFSAAPWRQSIWIEPKRFWLRRGEPLRAIVHGPAGKTIDLDVLGAEGFWAHRRLWLAGGRAALTLPAAARFHGPVTLMAYALRDLAQNRLERAPRAVTVFYPESREAQRAATPPPQDSATPEEQARAALRGLDPRLPPPEGAELAAEWLLRSVAPLRMETNEDAAEREIFLARMSEQLRPLGKALEAAELEQPPATLAELEAFAERAGLERSILIDPWGTPYRAQWVTIADLEVLGLVSAGPGKSFGDGDDFVLSVARRSHTAPPAEPAKPAEAAVEYNFP